MGVHISIEKKGKKIHGYQLWEDVEEWDYLRQQKDREFASMLADIEISILDEDAEVLRPKNLEALEKQINKKGLGERYQLFINLLRHNPEWGFNVS